MKEFENKLISSGYKYIAGVDEVGRGCLAGPVVAAAVILLNNINSELIFDSKKMTKKQLQVAYDFIVLNSIEISFSEVSVDTIDQINIKQASRLAMKKAINKLEIKPDFILVDFENIDTNIKQKGIVKGDTKSISIAAASIIAKVERDKIMKSLHKKAPFYQWDRNVGYGTKYHINKIKEIGFTKYHRKTFSPIKNMIK